MGTSNTKQQASIFEKEMTSFLQLATGEIKLSMKDASGSVQMLTKTFMDMVRDVHEIKALAEAMEKNQKTDNAKEINKICDGFLDKVQDGTTGFQFYDKLTQRLAHTSESIRELNTMIEQPNKHNDTSEWDSFKENLKSRYNTETDRQFYDALMQGSSIKEAIRIAMNSRDNTKSEGSVELF